MTTKNKNPYVLIGSDFTSVNHLKIKKIADKFDRFNDEIFDELIDRIPRLFETFQESKCGRFETYCFMSLNFYARKKYFLLIKESKRFYPSESVDSDRLDIEDWQETTKETANCEYAKSLCPVVLANLDERERWYLEQRFIKGCSVESIAEFLDVHVDTVYKRLRYALKKAKELVD